MTSATSAAWRAGLNFFLALRRLAGLCFVFSRGLGATFEICRVPTAAAQLKTGRGKLLGESLLAAFGAGSQRCIAHFAQNFFLVTAITATVFVDRQGRISLKIKIIP